MSLIHQIALTLVKSVGHVHAKNLLARFGSAEAIFDADKSQLLAVQGIGEFTASQLLNTHALSMAAKQLHFIQQHKIEILFYTDDRYPRRLKDCYDAPVLLYYKGNADLNHHRIVSIVGTRNATAYGQALCRQLAEVLQPYNVLIVSGLAYGIDVTAHKESLSFDIPTIGVLGHGLDMMYPPVHKQIAGRMLKCGGLLTEFPPGSRVHKENFPKRNRIIAGISDLTIVVEAAMKGGALITAEIAGSYNRDVFAFPGRTSDIYSQGCNFLIKTNRAGLITQPKDLIYYMGWDDVLPEVPGKQMEIPPDLSAGETKILTVLQGSPLEVDELCAAAGMQQSKLAIYLLNLELKGLILVLPGKVYTLNLQL